MSERKEIQGAGSANRSSLGRECRKVRRTRFYLPFPPGFCEMNEGDQRDVCRAMAEEIQRLLA